jgi:hypothetical protein
LSDVTQPFPDGRRKHSVAINQPDILPSLKNLKNKHLSDYSEQKTRALTNMLSGSVHREDYSPYFIKNTSGSKRPSALSIFPHVGMITNKNTYTTNKMVVDQGVY